MVSELLYVEQFVSRAKHIEVQVIGDGSGQVSPYLGTRMQRAADGTRKLVEIAPSPTLESEVRAKLCAAAVALGGSRSLQRFGAP